MEHRVLTLASIIDAYVANYQGRDPSLLTCLDFWRSQLGELELTAIDADTIEDAMAELAERGAMRYVCGKGLCPRDGRNGGHTHR